MIPNAEKLDEDDLSELCFEGNNPKMTVVIKLIPGAEEFDYEDLEKVYEKIHEFITKA